MIFVAIGTTDFEALVEAMDALGPTLDEEIVMQIGHSRCEPRHARFFRFAPALTPYYQQASVIVSHGGLGVTTEVMRLGKPLVTVEDPNQPDRHQREILGMWEAQGHLIWCRELAALPAAMAQARAHVFEPYVVPEGDLHVRIAGFLDTLR